MGHPQTEQMSQTLVKAKDAMTPMCDIAGDPDQP